jgi:hypothetical protein
MVPFKKKAWVSCQPSQKPTPSSDLYQLSHLLHGQQFVIENPVISNLPQNPHRRMPNQSEPFLPFFRACMTQERRTGDEEIRWVNKINPQPPTQIVPHSRRHRTM